MTVEENQREGKGENMGGDTTGEKMRTWDGRGGEEKRMRGSEEERRRGEEEGKATAVTSWQWGQDVRNITEPSGTLRNTIERYGTLALEAGVCPIGSSPQPASQKTIRQSMSGDQD